MRVLEHPDVADVLKTRPALDLGPCVFSIAMKEGASEVVHLDFSDSPDWFAWVVAVGDWTGGEGSSV